MCPTISYLIVTFKKQQYFKKKKSLQMISTFLKTIYPTNFGVDFWRENSNSDFF